MSITRGSVEGEFVLSCLLCTNTPQLRVSQVIAIRRDYRVLKKTIKSRVGKEILVKHDFVSNGHAGEWSRGFRSPLLYLPR